MNISYIDTNTIQRYYDSLSVCSLPYEITTLVLKYLLACNVKERSTDLQFLIKGSRIASIPPTFCEGFFSRNPALQKELLYGNVIIPQGAYYTAISQSKSDSEINRLAHQATHWFVPNETFCKAGELVCKRDLLEPQRKIAFVDTTNTFNFERLDLVSLLQELRHIEPTAKAKLVNCFAISPVELLAHIDVSRNVRLAVRLVKLQNIFTGIFPPFTLNDASDKQFFSHTCTEPYNSEHSDSRLSGDWLFFVSDTFLNRILDVYGVNFRNPSLRFSIVRAEAFTSTDNRMFVVKDRVLSIYSTKDNLQLRCQQQLTPNELLADVNEDWTITQTIKRNSRNYIQLKVYQNQVASLTLSREYEFPVDQPTPTVVRVYQNTLIWLQNYKGVYIYLANLTNNARNCSQLLSIHCEAEAKMQNIVFSNTFFYLQYITRSDQCLVRLDTSKDFAEHAESTTTVRPATIVRSAKNSRLCILM